MSPPRVSVVLPVRDGEAHLEEAVDSILLQTFVDLELVVVDDGSVDSTPRLLADFAAHDVRVRVHRLDRVGLVAALNAGIEVAHGVYVARMDADDVSLPRRIERQVAELDRRPRLGVLGTQVRYIDAAGSAIGLWSLPLGEELVRWSLCFGTPLAHPSVMIRRSLLVRHAYSAAALHAEDYDLWLRLSAETQLDNLPEILFERRVHGASISDLHEDEQATTAAEVQRRAVAAALGREPSTRQIEVLRAPHSIVGALTAMLLIWRLYRRSPRTPQIRRDAARRSIDALRTAVRAR